MQHITYYERQIIETELRRGKSKRAIARHLGRDHRVVAREIDCNSGEVLPYTAVSAQRIADRHERERTKKKLEKYVDLRNHVMSELCNEVLPEQIAGTLAKHPPTHLKGKTICHETIYQYIYAGEGHYV